MGKAKFVDERIVKHAFTILNIDKEEGIFTYIDAGGEEKEGCLDTIFDKIDFPIDVLLKTATRDELDVVFERQEE